MYALPTARVDLDQEVRNNLYQQALDAYITRTSESAPMGELVESFPQSPEFRNYRLAYRDAVNNTPWGHS